MVIISKPLFYEKIGPDITCRDFIHQWTDSCLKANLKLSSVYGLGIFNTYLQIFFEISDVRYDSWWFDLRQHMLCKKQISNFPDRLYYCNVTFVPGFVSGLSIFLEQPENRYFNTLIWLSMVPIPNGSNIICKKFLIVPKLFEKFPFIETLFMISNGILFYNRIAVWSTCPKYYLKMTRIASGG
ncbi:uncharacterized protein BDFB_008660, partial [Asbolus verrucosus]